MILAILFVTLFLAPLLLWLGLVHIVQFRFRHLPGPVPSALLGNMGLLKQADGLQEVWSNLEKVYGRMFLFWAGADPWVIISGWEDVKTVCVQKFRQFHDRPANIPPMQPSRREAAEAGILVAKGKLWASLRAAAQPVFHAESLSQYAESMNAASDRMVDSISALAASGDHFKFNEVAGKMTMAVVLKCAFGVDVPMQEGDDEHAAIKASKAFFARNQFRNLWVVFIMSLPSFLKPLARRLAYIFGDKSMEKSRDVMYAMSDQLAASYCKAEGLPPFVTEPSVLGAGRHMQVFPPDTVPTKNSIVAAMMHATNRDTGAPLTPTQLVSQANTFILAGYETTATAVTFTVYLLARNPDAKRKLLAEIDAVGRDVRPTYENIDQWPYAKACFREALRVYPVAPIIGRTCLEDTSVGGKHIPKGTSVFVNIMSMHHNPEYFPSPELFRPERFIDAAAAGNPDLHPAYMPFGIGPHNCIGWRFAQEEGLVMLIRLYQKYIFRLSETHHPDGALPLRSTITISPKDGLWVKAIAR